MANFKELAAEMIKTQVEVLSFEEIMGIIEKPKHVSMGEYAFPCFKLAKAFKKSPNMIAGEIATKVSDQLAEVDKSSFEKVEAVGAYVNFKVDKGVFVEVVLSEVLDQGTEYGKGITEKVQKVLVDFSSTNISKPFHIGHFRSTMIGDSLCKIYRFLGHDVVGINHLGDYGTQFGTLIVAYKRWGSKEIVEKAPIDEMLKLYVQFHKEEEAMPSLRDEARYEFKKLEDGDAENIALWEWFTEESLKDFNRIYDLLGCTFDEYIGERFYMDKTDTVVDELIEKNLLVESEGAQIVDLDAFGMAPGLIKKSDGTTLYMTRDLAAAFYRKKTYDFDKVLYVVATQQNLHFKQWFKIVELMGYDWAKDLIHVPFGMVSLENGAMSTRKGNLLRLEDVMTKAMEMAKSLIQEKNPSLENKEEVARQVGIGAIIFQELSHNKIKDYVFAWDKMLSFDGESGPYVQYTHARACSVLRKAGVMKDMDMSPENVDYSLLVDDASLDIARLINDFNSIVQDAADKNEPSLIARYVLDVAKAFNKFYHDNKIIVEDESLKKARLAVVKGITIVLKNGLALISMEAPERM